MSEFLAIQRYDVPSDLPYIVQAVDAKGLPAYEAWCYKNLGKKAGEKPDEATWFQARGYFFFANRPMRDQFMRLAGAHVQRRIQSNGSTVHAGSGQTVRELLAKLYNEFPADPKR